LRTSNWIGRSKEEWTRWAQTTDRIIIIRGWEAAQGLIFFDWGAFKKPAQLERATMILKLIVRNRSSRRSREIFSKNEQSIDF